jgi:O-antigen ligase
MEKFIKLSFIPLFVILLFPAYSNADFYLRTAVGFPFTIPMISLIFFLLIFSTFLVGVIIFKQTEELFRLYVAMGWLLVPFFLLIVIRLVYLLHPDAPLIDSNVKLYTAPYYYIFMVLSVAIACTETIRKYHRIIFLIFLCGMTISIWVDTIKPGTFSASTNRAAGFAINSNLAATAVLFVGIAAVDWKVNRPLNLACLIITGLGIFLTLSAGGLFFYILTIGLYVLLVLRKSFSFAQIIMGALVVLFLGVSGFLVKDTLFSGDGLLATKTTQDRLDEFMSIASGDMTFVEQHDRIDLIRDYLFLISEKPVLGYGTKFSSTLHNGPHNLFLLYWVENGLIGLLGLIFAMGSGFYYFYKMGDLRGMVFIFVFAVACNHSHAILNYERVYILLGMLGALAYLDNLKTKSFDKCAIMAQFNSQAKLEGKV